MLNIKKILIYALVICMLIPTICNVNVLAVEDNSLVDVFTEGVFCITEDRMFVDLVKLLDGLSDPIGFSDAYSRALGQLITSDDDKLNNYNLTSFAVVGFTRFMNDNDFSIDELEDYLDDKDKAAFKAKIEGKADELSLALENAGIDEDDQNSLTSGFAQMNSIFNKIAILDIFESAISDHEFYIAISVSGDLELDSSKASNFVSELYGDEVANDAINAMEDFVDYYNDIRKSDKKLIYNHLDEYSFINLQESDETGENPDNSGGGLPPTPPEELTDDTTDTYEKQKVEIESIITSSNTIEATVNPTDLSDAWGKTQLMKDSVNEEAANNNKKAINRVILEVPQLADIEKVEITLPIKDIQTLEGTGLDFVEVSSQIGSVEFNTSSILEEGQKPKEIKFSMKNVSDVKHQGVPEGAIVVDFNLSVDGEKISKFKSPIKVAIPYDPKQGEKFDEITVYFLQSDGTSKPVGGVYNTLTKKVEFITNHFSKYYAKASRISFNDVKADYWATEYIEILAGKGIINGKGSDSFDPYADITRAEFVALITRMLNLVKTDEIIPFTDISETAWYANEVLAAHQIGLINGRSDTTFVPNAPITRQEASVVITNTLKYLGYDTEQDAKLIDKVFDDYVNIASWAKNAVSTTYREEIINGKPNNLFDPIGNTTRAEVAKMIYVLFKK